MYNGLIFMHNIATLHITTFPLVKRPTDLHIVKTGCYIVKSYFNNILILMLTFLF